MENMSLNIIKIIKRITIRTIELTTNDPMRIADVWRKRGVKIGSNTYVYKNVMFGRRGRDPISIGSNCVLTGCSIIGHDASTNTALGLKFGELSPIQPVIIEDDCFIGHGSIILMGVKIGKGSIVGAGAVVSSDVPTGSVVAGNPARVICTTAQLIEKRKQLAITHPEFFPVRPRILDED